jgi:CO/xanthine dehydrogenase Mo-binding subunit
MSLGKAKPIRDAEAKVRGNLRYAGDMDFPGMLHAKLLLSPHAHALIEHIDVERAKAIEGVSDIVWHEHVPQVPYNSAMRFDGHKVPENERIFDSLVRFVGDKVAAVAAETREGAAKAVRAIEVKYRELPACFTIEDALKNDAVLIHPEGNRVATIHQEAGNVDAAFTGADHIFESTYETPPIHQFALENHCYTAIWEGGKLTLWSTSQNSFAVRLLLARLFSLPLHKVRVIKPPLGGAFGGKLSMVHEPVAAVLAMRTGRPVRLELTRRESILTTRTRHASKVTIKTGVRKDGRILAQDIQLWTNTGAYCSAALNVVGAISHKVFKLYDVPHIRFTGTPVYTNLPVAGAMRGYGSPQVVFALEVQMREIAEALHIDPVELQLKNLVGPGGTDPRKGVLLGNPRPLDCVRKGAELFGWPEIERKEDGRVRGIGMAVGLHGNGVFGAHRDFTALSIKFNEDGTAVLFTGTHDMGNGSVTIQTMVLAHELGIEAEDIECIETDTDVVPWNLGDFASRGVFVSAEAARLLGKKAASEILSRCSDLFELDSAELELHDRSVIHSKTGAVVVSLKELLSRIQGERQEEIMVQVSYASVAGRTSYGAHFAQVAVDPGTGAVEVERYCAVHDAGKVLNPLGIEGQLEGGIHMGIGYALCEGLFFDGDGVCKNAGAGSYRLIKASQMPGNLVTDFLESSDDPGPYGAKSIGECAVVPSAPAVVNAVANALGTNLRSIPLENPEVDKRKHQ